jgi:hypothetical protein
MLRVLSEFSAAFAFPSVIRTGCRHRRGPYDDEAATEFNRSFAQSGRVLRPTLWTDRNDLGWTLANVSFAF